MKTNMPRFDIILVVYNRLDYTKRTIASLISSGAHENCERFIIVDNRSSESGIRPFMLDLAGFQRTFVLYRSRNDGWATAVNDCLGMSRAPYLFLLNNDVEFKYGFYEQMIETMENNPLSLLGGWRHKDHSVTAEHHNYDEMTDIPAVCWLLNKASMEMGGMLEERGPCSTKGGNGEDSEYVQRMAKYGQVGATKQDVAHHIDGY